MSSPHRERSVNSPVDRRFASDRPNLIAEIDGFLPAYAEGEAMCETANFLLGHNARISAEFMGEPTRSERERYMSQHPTEILVFKCMDGRLHLTMMSELPTGAVDPYRNIAGKFDLGWPKLCTDIKAKVTEASAKGQRLLALCSYHYASGCRERGCRGMQYDTNAARGEAEKLATQFLDVFAGGARAAVIPLVMGIETDEEALIFEAFHDDTDQLTFSLLTSKTSLKRLDTRDFAARVPDAAAVLAAVTSLLPGVDRQLAKDLAPIVINNAKHIYERRQLNLPIIELDHKETVIAVGTGFDWLHVPNKAFIIGPYDHLWPQHVATAASIVTPNVDLAANDGIVLITSAYCSDQPGSYGWKLAENTAKYYAKVSQEAIVAQKTLLAKTKVHVLVGVVDRATLKFHPVV